MEINNGTELHCAKYDKYFTVWDMKNWKCPYCGANNND